ncbi:MAG: XRE family transcriptional regulator [Alphaproteobacteria bacterium]|nr:XRE family transcriptional regulator [Alphaproteobacteria bacterium]
MDKRERARLFRKRLLTAMEKAGYNRGQLASAASIDRSTLGQLLAENETRLPNGHTLAELSDVLGVSADWLIGLSQEARTMTTFLEGAMDFRPERSRSPVDENLATWYEDAAGMKIRHVPSTLPDSLKSEELLRFEYRDYIVKTTEQAIADSRDKLAYTRLPQTDMEICMPVQALEVFAAGEGVWKGFPKAAREKQLSHMARLMRELYPGLRVYGFDHATHFSAPYTVFGSLRAAIYLGQSYVVLNTTMHVRQLTQHFDDLIRHAKVHAHEMADFVEGLECR